jgi:hypothetical protein
MSMPILKKNPLQKCWGFFVLEKFVLVLSVVEACLPTLAALGRDYDSLTHCVRKRICRMPILKKNPSCENLKGFFMDLNEHVSRRSLRSIGTTIL